MTKIVFISVDNNHKLYERCVKDNPFIKNNKNISCVAFDNTKENKFISVRYNEFLNNCDFKNEAWFVFCHNDWEILEDLEPKLQKLDKNTIWGPIGATMYKKADNCYIKEFVGCVYERKRDSSNLRMQKSHLCETGTKAEILDAQCMIIHSSLFQKYNLRFDEKCEFDMYVEDFLLNAQINCGLSVKILNLNCCHWSQVDTLDDRPRYFDMLNYAIEKWKDYELSKVLHLCGNKDFSLINQVPKIIYLENFEERELIYKNDVGASNDPRRYSINWITPEAKVLDVGCACGDFGVALKKEKNCDIFALEYCEGSIKVAKETGAYKDIFQVDLNTFKPKDFEGFYNKFDYIILGDVLEHLINPQEVLNKLSTYLKDGGEFLISFPNISHASIKMNLLVDDWTYTDVGLLDRTHLRFFTKNSIPTFLAELGIKVCEMKYTVMSLEGFQPHNPWFKLPISTRNFISQNPHSFICQYVVRAKIDRNKTYSELSDINTNEFVINKRNATKELKKKLFRSFFFTGYWYYLPYIIKYRFYKNILRNRKKTEKYRKKLGI